MKNGSLGWAADPLPLESTKLTAVALQTDAHLRQRKRERKRKRGSLLRQNSNTRKCCLSIILSWLSCCSGSEYWEHWGRGRNTPWMGFFFIALQHKHRTHLKLWVIRNSNPQCFWEVQRKPGHWEIPTLAWRKHKIPGSNQVHYTIETLVMGCN